MPAKLMSVKELSETFGPTERGIRKQLETLEPDGKTSLGGAMYYADRYARHVYGSAGTRQEDLTAARTRLASEQADEKAMDNAVRRGQLAPPDWYEDRAYSLGRQCAAAFDAVMPLVRNTMPHLPAIDYARLEGILVRVRSGLADRLDSGGGEPPIDPQEDGGPDSQAATTAAERMG